MRRGHIAIRTCVVCSSKKPKPTCLRVALEPEEGLLVLDHRMRSEGRGIYVCPECLPQLRFNKRVQKAFRNSAKGLSKEITQYSQA